MTIAITSQANTLSFPIEDQGYEVWEDRIRKTAVSVFNSISIEETNDLVDLSEIERQTTLRNRIEEEFLSTVSNAEEYGIDINDDVFIVKLTSELATEMQGQLEQTLIDRAYELAKGLKELLSRNPDTQRVLEGLEYFFSIAEGFLSEFNINPEVHTNSEAIYWETFRDYFAVAVTELDFDFN